MYGTDCTQVLVSASFSVARCNRPICGSARWTTSPSSSSTRRRTPCAAGCCGPKLSVKLRISAMYRTPVGIFAHDARGILTRLDCDGLVNHTSRVGVIAHLDVTGNREIPPERMDDEPVIRQHTTQIVMPKECNSVQIEGFALEPVGGRPNGRDRLHCREAFVFCKHTHPQANILRDREKMNDNCVTPSRPSTIPIGRIIDTTKINQLFKAKIGIIAQRDHQTKVVRRTDFNGHFTERQLQGLYLVAEM